MRAIRQPTGQPTRPSTRRSEWLRTVVGALIVLSLAVSGPAFAQDSVDDDDDDFLSDDYDDFLDGEDDFEDDFLADDFAETVEEVRIQEKGVYYWAFEVPVDILILRPVGALDVAIGGMFVTTVALPIATGALADAIWSAATGDGWYYDTTNFDAALDQAVINPSEFLFDRPLGQLIEIY